jgi:cyclic pyranopterin phosphate synthase
MVDVGHKEQTKRRAVAEATVYLASATADLLANNALAKGDALATARIAGVMAAKHTAHLIPLCHPLPLTHAHVDIDVDSAQGMVRVRATCETVGRTGVEMEALTAATVACLTIYDMCKAVQRDIRIGDIALVEKEGGKSGSWRRENYPATSDPNP